MGRKPRYYLADVPCHIIQRGNNRQQCFFADDDYSYYLECLQHAAETYGCAVHAYVLMTNHVHLLMTPSDGVGISRVMQSVGRRYVQYVNHRQSRTGTLWEGRHKASLIDSERYLLSCYRYIEMNPVRARMAVHPRDYVWSSYRANAEGKQNALLTAHDEYERLGRDPRSRHLAYRALFKRAAVEDPIDAIRRAANLGVPLGSAGFRAWVDQRLGAPISYRPRGRPTKAIDVDA